MELIEYVNEQMVPLAGLEPATVAVETPCSYSTELQRLEQGTGFEPVWDLRPRGLQSLAFSRSAIPV